MLRKRITELQAQKESEKEWWEGRKKTIEAELMGELEAGETKAPSRTSDDDTVLVEAGGPAANTGSVKGKKKGGKR
jgi:translocation protein SEC66